MKIILTVLLTTIKNISAKEIQELANKYLTPEDFYELVVV